MKRMFALLLALSMTLSMLSVGAGAEEVENPSMEPAAEETLPAETAPAETVPAEPVPEETEPAEPVPAEPVPAETVPAEPVPEETEPAETEPEETEPAETGYTVSGTVLVVTDYAAAEEQGAFSEENLKEITAVCFTCTAEGVEVPVDLTAYYPYGNESWTELAAENDELVALIGETVPGTEGTVLVTFSYRGETIAVEAVAEGETPAVLPEALDNGKAIYGWFLDDARVDAAALAVTEDTEYVAVTAPALITDEHPVYVSGKGNASFDPNGSLTRAEATVMFSNLLDAEGNGQIDASFTDVQEDDPNAWYYKYVTRLASYGLVGGYEDGTFMPNNNITRAEFVTILSNLFPMKDGGMPFTDVTEDNWAYKYISNAYAYGWSSGDEGKFKPDSNITRAEAVTMLNAVMGRSAKSETTQELIADANLCSFVDVTPNDWFYPYVLEAATVHTFEMSDGEENWTGYTYGDTGYQEGMVTIAGYKYVVDANGQFTSWTLKPGHVTINGEVWYVDANGRIPVMTAGLHDLADGTMVCVQADGSLLANGSSGYLTFGADGSYTTGDAELDAMVDAALVAAGCDKCATKDAALRAAYVYIRDNDTYLSRDHHSRGDTSWTVESAKFMFTYHRGNCYCFAATFLYMARRLGYQAYPISGGVGTANSDHAWVMIKWSDGVTYLFDPELEYAYRYRYTGERRNPSMNIYKKAPGTYPFVYYFA